ncbi:hypothetical protein [Priestia aryabhattai]
MELLTYLDKSNDGKELVELFNKMSMYDSEEQLTKENIAYLEKELALFRKEKHTVSYLLMQGGKLGIKEDIEENTSDISKMKTLLLNRYAVLIQQQKEKLLNIKTSIKDLQSKQEFEELIKLVEEY